MSERARVFGMVNMQLSWEYTSYALKTFAKNTSFSEDDIFVLVDDDGSFGAAPDWILPRVELLCNSSTRTLAQNMNAVLEIARQRSADFYFFHNDLIFTEGWSDPMRENLPSIIVPATNQDFQYDTANFTWREELILTEYTKRAPFLREALKIHRSQQQGMRTMLSTSFCAVKIPIEIYQAVGNFDESFPRLGGEDHDYCLRAVQAGFKVEQALNSFLLHFRGKSTIEGGETPAETQKRIAAYRDLFEKKWGAKLLKLILDKDNSVIQSSPEGVATSERGDLSHLVELLK